MGGSGSSEQPTPAPVETPSVVERDWWDVDAPNYTESATRPSITIEGESVIRLALGGSYEELGASATDAEDGDLTEQIQMQGTIDTESVGDYFVRDSVADSDGNVSIDKTRLVRVVDEDTANFSLRELREFQVNLGCVEYLPPDSGLDPEQKFPLLIYQHGNGANAEFAADGQDGALDNVVQNFGPPTLMRAGRWDKELPFIVLTPQAGFIEGSDPAQRIDIFLQHAELTYNVDTSRVYMMGWSQGGGVTMLYARNFPEKLAAVISISAGSPFVDDLTDNFCNAENVPLWIFYGGLDGVVSVDNSIPLFGQTIGSCQPTIVPRFTLYPLQGHNIHHLSAMAGARFEYEVDSNNDPFDMSIYDWLLTFTHER